MHYRKDGDPMDLDTFAALCRSLAKAYSASVRLYRGAEPLAYCSVYPLDPDPAGPYISRMLDCGAEVGIITTPAYQFYGFLTVEPELRVILGHTRAYLCTRFKAVQNFTS